MDLVSRLKLYLNNRGIGITQFADECDIPRPSASQLLAGRNKKVSDEIIGKIHHTYPDLSISWLMFGEGDMVTNINIETSEAKNSPLQKKNDPIQPINQDIPTSNLDLFSVDNSSSEKLNEPEHDEFSFGASTFDFTEVPSQPLNSHIDNETAPQSTQNTTTHTAAPPIIVTPDKGKRVTGIVVYYSDSTYESFIPDPDTKQPFKR